jgi:hypothetical protein
MARCREEAREPRRTPQATEGAGGTGLPRVRRLELRPPGRPALAIPIADLRARGEARSNSRASRTARSRGGPPRLPTPGPGPRPLRALGAQVPGPSPRGRGGFRRVLTSLLNVRDAASIDERTAVDFLRAEKIRREIGACGRSVPPGPGSGRDGRRIAGSEHDGAARGLRTFARPASAASEALPADSRCPARC